MKREKCQIFINKPLFGEIEKNPDSDLTPESAELSDDAVLDVGDPDEAGVVGLGDQRRVGHGEAAHGDVDHVGADLDRGELDAEAAVALLDHLVGDVRAFLGAWKNVYSYE